MRKLLSCFAIYLSIIYPLKAQKGIAVGLSAGTGHSVKRTEWSNPNSTFGRTNLLTPWWVGAYIQKPLVNGLFVGVDLQYSRSRFRISDYDDKTVAVNKYQYIGVGPYAGLRLWKWVNVVGSLTSKILVASQRTIITDVRPSVWYVSPRLNLRPTKRIQVDIGYERALKNFASVRYFSSDLAFYYNDSYYLTLKYDLLSR
jgi:hypothetical protein